MSIGTSSLIRLTALSAVASACSASVPVTRPPVATTGASPIVHLRLSRCFCFEQEYPNALVLSEPGGEHRARGAGTDDHVVETFCHEKYH